MAGRFLRKPVLGLNLFLNTGMLMFFSIILVMGCSRKEEENRSTITFQIDHTLNQKVGALAVPSGYELSHIVINVQASDLDKVFWSWDADCGSQCYSLPPSDISLDVTSGTDRLIQYLGVYESRTAGSKSLYFVYGDTLATLYPGSQYVDLVASVYGGESQVGKEVHVAGQYVESVENGIGKGPTGKVSVEFSPPNGQPAMTVFYSEIFNGWIELFGLEAISFQYRLLSNNQVLFSDVRASSIDAKISSNFLKVVAPQDYWIYESSGYYRQGEGGTLYFGFFGPAVDKLSAKACYKESATTISNLYRDSTGTQTVNWSLTPSATDVYLAGGGVAESSCAQETELTNKITFDPSYLRHGLWSSSGFKGPFKRESQTFSVSSGGCYNGSGSYASGCYDSSLNEYEIKWSYLPNVFSNTADLSGVTLFMREEQTCDSGCNDDEIRSKNGDGYRCDELESLGFLRVKDFGSADSPTYRSAYTLASGRQLKSILCPYKDENGVKKYYTTGVRVEGLYNYSNGDGGTNGGTPDGNNSKHLYFMGNTTTVINSCTTYTINASSVVNVATMISLSGAGSGTFYSDSSCTGQAITSVSIPASLSSATFYYQNSISEYVYFAASVSSGDTSFSSIGSFSVTVNSGADNGNGTTATLSFSGLVSETTANTCIGPISLNVSVAPSSALDISLSQSGSAYLYGSFYSDAGCTTSLTEPTVSLSANQTYSSSFYYKNTSPAASSVAISATATGYSAISQSLSITITNTSTYGFTSPAGASSVSSSTFLYGTCDFLYSTLSVRIDSNSSSNITCSSGAWSVSFSSLIGFGSLIDSTSFTVSISQNGGTEQSRTFTKSSTASGSLSISGPSSVTTYDCEPYWVTSSTSVSVNTEIALTIAGQGLLYAYGDNTCSGSTISSITILAGSTMSGFYYKSDIEGSASLSLSVTSGDSLLMPDSYFIAVNTPLFAGDGSDGSKSISTAVNMADDTSMVQDSESFSKVLSASRNVKQIVFDGGNIFDFGLSSSFNAPDGTGSTATDFEVNDLVMWMVMSERGASSCGGVLMPGNYGFGRITATTSSASPPSFKVDTTYSNQYGGIDLPSTNMPDNAKLSAFREGTSIIPSHCGIQVVRVPEFSLLTFTTGGTFKTSPYNTASGFGGVIAVKVQTAIDMSGGGGADPAFDLSGSGYDSGALSSFYAGAGVGGKNTASGAGAIVNIENGGGGGNGDGGGGGGNAGQGGAGSIGSAGSFILALCGSYCDAASNIFMGGAGGGAPAFGGGVLILHTQNMKNGTFAAKSNGQSPLCANGGGGGGGGAGGSLYVWSNHIESTLTNISLDAAGADGVGANPCGNSGWVSGGGGGGHVQVDYCSSSQQPLTVTTNVLGGLLSAGSGGGGSGGDGTTSLLGYRCPSP